MHDRFLWHRQSAIKNTVESCRETRPSPVDSINGVHYIKDVNGESTLRAIQQSIHDHVEFCVLNESIQLTDALTKASQTNIGNPNNALEKRVGETHPGFQCLSSGSNGRPKCIRRTHASWINSFNVTVNYAKLSVEDSYAIIGRLSHSLALYAALEAAWIGADIHLLCNLRPNQQRKALTELKSSVLYATPTQLRLLCNSQPNQTSLYVSVKHIFCGGGKLDQHTYQQLALHFPNARVQEFYGASETSFISMSDETTPIDSVGKLYPGVQLHIKPVDADRLPDAHSNNALTTDTVGEIWVKSPYLFTAYASGYEKHTRWHNDYLSIGEMGYIDSNDHLYLTGRRSRMVNIADNMVFPELIEHFFNGLDDVRQCALLPVRDTKRGIVLIAIVEAHETEQLRSQLLLHSRKKFGALASPREIVFVEHLPLLLSGKPDLITLERQFG